MIKREYLYQRYIIDGLTVSQIALETKLTKDQVKSNLRKHGIRKKPLKLTNEIYDDKEWLYHQYMVLQKGYSRIADELEVSYTTIRDRILFFGWPVRGHGDIDKGASRRGKRHSENLC